MATADTDRMILELSAQMRSFEKAMIDAAGNADRAAQRIERRFDAMNRKVTQDFNRFTDGVRTALATIGVGALAHEVVELGDTWTQVGNRLAFAGVSASRLATVQQVVANIASETRNDLDATADLFARMYRSSQDLGASLTQVARVTEIVSKALAGAAQSERQGAVRQLGQALGSGRLQGDELRSILENSRPLADAIAREFNTNVGNLRKLGQAGVLESRRVFHAIEAAGDQIDASFARTQLTVADSFTRLRTEAARFIGTNAQTSASVHGLSGLINFVADNFKTLADAVVITATVLGGALAGQAIARAITALTQLEFSVASTKRALAFFGGPLGILLTTAGVALAYVATQTDLLTTSAQALDRASNSSYSALQKIASLSDDLHTLAEEGGNAADNTSAIATAGRDAQTALDQLATSSGNATERLSGQAEITASLAAIERQRTIDTLAQAVADERAAIAAIRRNAVLRGLQETLHGRGPTHELALGNFGVTPDEQRQIDESNRLIALFERARTAASGLDLSAWQQLFEMRQQGADADTTSAAATRHQLRDLEAQAAISLARLQHDSRRLQILEDSADIEKRSTAYVAAGVSATEALTRATAEVTAERKASNIEARRNYEISRLQDESEIARTLNQQSLLDKLQDELEIRRRTRDLVDQMAMSEANARALAEEQVATLREARDADRSHQLELRGLQDQVDQAQARGDARAQRALEQRLELENRIADLRRLGLSEKAARDMAAQEVAALEQADFQGKFRQWFTGGVMASLDGDLGDFFENWLRERARAGLEDALNQVADTLFDVFKPTLTNIIREGQTGAGQAIAGLFSQGAGGGIKKLADDAAAVGDVIKGTLGDAAKGSAAKLLFQGAQSALAATKEAASSSLKVSADLKASYATTILAKSAISAADALASMSATGGGKGGGFLGDILNGIGSLFGGGGGIKVPTKGFAGGGRTPIGEWFTVGENGPEKMKLGVPGFVLPNGVAAGGGGFSYVDASRYNFVGTQAEFAEFRAAYEADLRSRKRQAQANIAELAQRRKIGRG